MQNARGRRRINEVEFENESACPYCGQINIMGGDCDCLGAKRAKKIEDQIRRAQMAIEEVFGEACTEEGYTPVSEDNIEFMNSAAVLLANYKIHAISIVLSSGTRAKLARGSKGAIKVERFETKKNSTEVEE